MTTFATTATDGPTLVTSPTPTELSPLEAAIMDGCNALHEARAIGDPATRRSLERRLEDLLQRYAATDAENHPNPRWAIPNQRALVASAAGRTADAIALELEAVKFADTPRRMEISLGNLSERCIRLGRYEDAVDYFLRARDASPHSIPVLLTGAQALHLAGFSTEANRLFASVLAQARAKPALLAPSGELGAYLDFESRLARMAPDLPALAELMELWAGATGG